MRARHDSREGPSPLLPLCLALAAILIHWKVGAGSSGFFTTELLLDTDSWTRALRVLALHEGAGWRDPWLPALSAPEGLSLHWTRPLDVMILWPARAAMQFGIEPRTAILWSGALLCPVLHGAAVFLGVWAARPLWPGMPAWFAGILVLGNGAALAYSLAGRSDHHSLLLLVALLVLGAGMRAALKPERRAMAWLAGLAGGFGIWVSPEALLVVAPMLLGLGCAWLIAWNGQGHAAAGLRAALGLAAMLAVAIFLERPAAEWGRIEQDKVSLQHLGIAGVVALCFLLAYPVGRFSRWLRLVWGGLLAMGAGAALHGLWPSLLSASLAAADPGAAELLLPRVAEMQPLRFATLADLADASIWIGTAPLALLALLLGLEFEGWSRNGRWAPALMLGLALLVTAAAAIVARRFALDLAAPASLAAAGLLPLLGRLLVGSARIVTLGVMAALLLAVPLGASLAMPEQTAADRPDRCPTEPVVAFLRAAEPAPPGAVMLTDNLNLGPELAWRTAYRQVAAPYHRGGAALLDLRAFLEADDDAAAAAILARRHVSLVLLCRGAPLPGGPLSAQALRSRLLEGERPEGWVAIEVPDLMSSDYLLLHIE